MENKKTKHNQWVYVVVEAKNLKIIDWELKNLENPTWPKGIKTFLAFKSRRTAMRWVNYWTEGKKYYKVIAVELEITPFGELIK